MFISQPFYFTSEGLQNIVMSMSVCLFACITQKPHGQTTKFFVHVACGSILLSQHCNTLCTSGFMDDVMFAYHGTSGQMALDKIRLMLQGLILLKPPIPTVTSVFDRVHHNAAPEAKSALCVCLVM